MSAKTTSARTTRLASTALQTTPVRASLAGKDGCEFDYPLLLLFNNDPINLY